MTSIDEEKRDQVLLEAVKNTGPREPASVDCRWIELIRQSLNRTQPEEVSIAPASQTLLECLRENGRLVPREPDRRFFYQCIVRYHLVWALEERLSCKKNSLKQFGLELNIHKDWWTNWKYHAPNVEQTALSLCSEYIGPEQIRLGRGEFGVDLAVRLGYLSWLRRNVKELGVGNKHERSAQKWCISNHDYRRLEWYRCGAAESLIEAQIVDLTARSELDKETLLGRWTRPFDLTYLIARDEKEWIQDDYR